MFHQNPLQPLSGSKNIVESYKKVLALGIQRIHVLLQTLEEKPREIGIPETSSELLFLSGFLGLQKVTNLMFWFQDFYQNNPDEKKIAFFQSELWVRWIKTVKEILDTVEIPDSYGEFVKPSGVVLRPLFSQETPVLELLEGLTLWHPVHAIRRFIYKLPMAVVSEYSYTLRVPTRYLETHAHEDVYLTLIYVDLTKQEINWLELAPLFLRLTQDQWILYQGALEIPYIDLHRKNEILPYYFLLKSQDPPKSTLKSWNLKGQILLRLKEPGVPLAHWTKEEIIEEDSTLFFYENNSSSAQLVNQELGDEPSTEEIPDSIEDAKKGTEPLIENLVETDEGGEFIAPTYELEDAGEFIAPTHESDDGDEFVAPAFEETLDDNTFSSDHVPSKTFRKPILISHELSVLPFTLKDLDSPDFAPPLGLENVVIATLSHGKKETAPIKNIDFEDDEIVVGDGLEHSFIEHDQKLPRPRTALTLVAFLLLLGFCASIWAGFSLYNMYKEQRFETLRTLVGQMAKTLEMRLEYLKRKLPELLTNSEDSSFSIPPEIFRWGKYFKEGVKSQPLPLPIDFQLQWNSSPKLLSHLGQSILWLPISEKANDDEKGSFYLLNTSILLSSVLPPQYIPRVKLLNPEDLVELKVNQGAFATHPLSLGSITLLLMDNESLWPWEVFFQFFSK